MSSVVPSDSVSATNSGGKKSRPGKKERAMKKGLSTASAQTAPSSMSNASIFSSGVVSSPIPQPGKFPVVFPSGAGEPTRDSLFALSPHSLASITSDLSGRYVSNSKFAEFASYADMVESDLETVITTGFYLGLAQQVVHAHQNMGLPQGDFSPVASTEVLNFSAVRGVLSQMGEFSSEILGTRFLLAGYEDTVKALVRAANRAASDSPGRLAETFWLPSSTDDKNTKYILAHSLANFVLPFGVSLNVEELASRIFVGDSDAWNAIKTLIGPEPPSPVEGRPVPVDTRDRFDFLFTPYRDGPSFVTLVTGTLERVSALRELRLSWSTPLVTDLDFGITPKVVFSPLADSLARKRATLAKFFSLGSGLSNRAVAAGSAAQMSSVQDRSGVVVVKSRLAVSAPEYSLLACFPFSGLFSDTGPLNVVLTTSLSVTQGATEFTQLDWL